jgi:hypothetical protein
LPVTRAAVLLNAPTVIATVGIVVAATVASGALGLVSSV